MKDSDEIKRELWSNPKTWRRFAIACIAISVLGLLITVMDAADGELRMLSRRVDVGPSIWAYAENPESFIWILGIMAIGLLAIGWIGVAVLAATTREG
ncbi:MAG: hypothetical protein E2576_26505 [Alcaligenaceae bacterium]|nr:hypothetical protein [Alcaligenaceae bacterium SAGV5]MPS52896.1 hypothetical protein [Alcaligenaceae bacterium SAGV3]MPT60289.1 hypothetical protein [Alcaligenaceae bacterium]